MANINDLKQEEVNEYLGNTRELYHRVISGIECGAIVPEMKAKHQRVYIRPAVPGEIIEVPADNATYTATEGQYVVYNDKNNRYLVNQKAYKKYEQDSNMEIKKDADGLEIKGHKPKGKVALVVHVNDLNMELGDGFTYFPSGWWGSTDTVKEGFDIVLPFDETKTLQENVEDMRKAYLTLPEAGALKEEVEQYLCSGKGPDIYGLDDGHVDTYARCDRKGTFADLKFRIKAGQENKVYEGQKSLTEFKRKSTEISDM